jgi:hypothetical protein
MAAAAMAIAPMALKFAMDNPELTKQAISMGMGMSGMSGMSGMFKTPSAGGNDNDITFLITDKEVTDKLYSPQKIYSHKIYSHKTYNDQILNISVAILIIILIIIIIIMAIVVSNKSNKSNCNSFKNSFLNRLNGKKRIK